jgi:hypothetical protein
MDYAPISRLGQTVFVRHARIFELSSLGCSGVTRNAIRSIGHAGQSICAVRENSMKISRSGWNSGAKGVDASSFRVEWDSKSVVSDGVRETFQTNVMVVGSFPVLSRIPSRMPATHFSIVTSRTRRNRAAILLGSGDTTTKKYQYHGASHIDPTNELCSLEPHQGAGSLEPFILVKE